MAAYVSSSSEDRDELFLQGLEVLQVLDEALKTKIYDYLALCGLILQLAIFC
jgi:hypothetical protein